MTLDHKTSLKSLEYIYSNSQQYIIWVKMIDLSFMPKIIRILSKDHILNRKYIKTSFLISNMHCQELYLGNFKSDLVFLIVVSQPNIVLS